MFFSRIRRALDRISDHIEDVVRVATMLPQIVQVIRELIALIREALDEFRTDRAEKAVQQRLKVQELEAFNEWLKENPPAVPSKSDDSPDSSNPGAD